MLESELMVVKGFASCLNSYYSVFKHYTITGLGLQECKELEVYSQNPPDLKLSAQPLQIP
jgi:hypothetical protein